MIVLVFFVETVTMPCQNERNRTGSSGGLSTHKIFDVARHSSLFFLKRGGRTAESSMGYVFCDHVSERRK
jgi:hypothetical protein